MIYGTEFDLILTETFDSVVDILSLFVLVDKLHTNDSCLFILNKNQLRETRVIFSCRALTAVDLKHFSWRIPWTYDSHTVMTLQILKVYM
jgi:hypothetical protein